MSRQQYEWIDDIYLNSWLPFRDLASKKLDYRCTPLHPAYWWWNFWSLCDLIFIIADYNTFRQCQNVKNAQLSTFNCWWQAVFRILISFIISSWMCSIKHSSHLDIVEMCFMSVIVKIKLHSDQKFHHQYAACSGVHPLPLKKVLHYAENVSYPLIIYKIFWTS